MGYNVSSVNGTADSYRSDGVDLETTSDATDTTGAGTYTVSLRVASPSGVTDALHIANLAGTNLSGTINIPATGAGRTGRR